MCRKPAETKLLIAVWHPFALWRPPARTSERVRERWPEMRVVHLPDYDRLKEELPGTHIFVGYSLRPQQFPWANELRWIHSTAAGVKQLMYPELQRSGIIVTNASGVHSVPMAEHILGMLIAIARRFRDAFHYQSEARWAQQAIWDSRPHPSELRGKVLLLIGFGAVGQEVARLAQPIGMRVRAVTRSGRAESGLAEQIYAVSDIQQALTEGDFIVLAAPETPETFHMIGAPQFQVMKKTAYFINVARGSLVDEAALVDALRKRAIAGAALDVTEQEPLPAESPLWNLENVFITPHLSAASESLWERQTDLLLENLDRWFSRRELLNRVDLERGY
jgi:D-2-hydroxyacid dehydrogenase (NADP+)